MKAVSVKGLKYDRARPFGDSFGPRSLAEGFGRFARAETGPEATEEPAARPIRLAWVTCVIPSYRINFLSRLAGEARFDMVVYHGQGKEGDSVTSAAEKIAGTNVQVRNLFWPTRRPRIMWQRGVWRVMMGGYDAVIMNENVHNLSNWLLFLGKFLFRYRLVLVGYGYRPQLEGGLHAKVRDWLRRAVLRRADSIVTYTDRGREGVCAMGISPGRVFVYGNTLDVDELLEIKGRLRRHRRKFPPPASVLRVAYLGRLVPVKRVDLLISALGALNQPERVSCQIIGDGTEREGLEAKAAHLPNIHFHGALYDTTKIARILMDCDLMVLPGRVGLTVIHAFCFGLPVITTGQWVEQSPEFDYLEDGVDSVVLSHPSAVELASVMGRLAQDRNLLWRLKLGARRKAGRFRMDRMVSEFVRAVDTAIT